MSLLSFLLHGTSTHATLGIPIYSSEVYVIVIAAFFFVILLLGAQAARDE